ncbi:hypothetical protein KQX54_014385 [Cotesia glomerata]|uniref:Cadherin domain-containing protein n=1 Tax=Cotesia glomerata TaxID=32391 RepID=A0AAV7IL46_COTGL|nr:hypothetical protein KQX54_014385 [Cotesia glomerata]
MNGPIENVRERTAFRVQATDPDCGVNSMVNYTLAAGQLASEQLFVRSDSGEICVRSPLDRELASYLELPVVATDRELLLDVSKPIAARGVSLPALALFSRWSIMLTSISHIQREEGTLQYTPVLFF